MPHRRCRRHAILPRKLLSLNRLTEKASLGQRLNGGSLSRRFKKYARKCGLSEGIHFHSLRRTEASWLVQSGVPLFSVQKILGHSSPIVTQIYSHLAEEHLREAVERIGGLTLNPHHEGKRRDIPLN